MCKGGTPPLVPIWPQPHVRELERLVNSEKMRALLWNDSPPRGFAI